MRIAISTLLVFFSCTSLWAQTFSTGHTTITFTDANRNNRSIPAEVYYPADVDGENVPLATQGGTFPVVVFGHGFVMVWSAYANIWTPLSENGFIAVFPTTEGSFSPNHTEFGKDIAFLVTAMQGEGNNASSPFFGRVDITSAVMGHSMGGGSSFLAMQYNPNITAVVNLAAAETNPSAIAACSTITQHALVIAGGNDCITPPATNQLAMYNALGSNCKVYVSIDGASHCQFANSNFNCTFGELTCTPAAAISRATQHSIVNSLIVPWLKFELENDCNAGLAFELLVTTPSGFTAQKNCYFCTVSIEEGFAGLSALEVFPSIGSGIIHVKNGVANTDITVYSVDGKMIQGSNFRTSNTEDSSIDLSHLETGLYMLRFQSPSGHVATRRVIISY
ncbi:MAG: poly(ethylene terephthalate) hydrolase family protein [Arcticibacter sp.]